MRVLVKWSNALTGSYVCFVWSHHFSITFELFNVLLQLVFVFLIVVVFGFIREMGSREQFGAPQRYKRKMSSVEEEGEGEKRKKARSKTKKKKTIKSKESQM